MSADSTYEASSYGAAPEPVTGRWTGRDTGLLLLLLLSAMTLRAWHFTHTEVIARDSIGFIRVAWRMGLEPLDKVVKESHQHPGYPAAVFLMAKVMDLDPAKEDRHHLSPDLAMRWQLAAQWTSAIAGTLLVIPMYLFGRALFAGLPTASLASFWATLMLQCLPAVGRLLTDGLSEGIFLLFAACSLLGGWLAISQKDRFGTVLCGLFSGLAYLVRPEGAFIGAWMFVGLLVLGLRRSQERTYRMLQAGTLASVLVLVALPYAMTIGGLTNKPTANQILNGADSPMGWPGGSAPLPEVSLAPLTQRGGLAMAFPLAVWWEGGAAGTLDRIVWGIKTLGFNWIKGMFWVLWIPQVAFFWQRRRSMFQVEYWAFWGLTLTMLAALFKVASQMGYLSDRHLALLLMLGSYPAAQGLLELLAPIGRHFSVRGGAWITPALNIGVPAILLVGCMVRTAEPLHGNRAGFREAGAWIAQNAQLGDPVDDAYCWSHYHAGRVFTEGAPKGVPVSKPYRQFYVIERSSNKHPRLQTVNEDDLKSKGAKEVFASQPRADKDKAVVVVYEAPWEGPSRSTAGK